MNRYLCLTFVLLSIININAQINFDSLYKVVDTTKSVHDKIDRFYFGSHRKKLTKKEFDTFHSGIIKIASKGDKKDEAFGYYREAWLYYYQSRYNESLSEFFNCLKIAEDLKDTSLIADVNAEIGDAYIMVRNFEYAKKHLYYVVEFIGQPKRKINDKDELVLDRCYQHLSTIYKEQNILDSSLKYANLKLDISLRTGKKKLISGSYNTLALVYKKAKDYDKAIIYLEKSYEIKKEIGEKVGQAAALINMGNVLNYQKKFEKAIDCFLKGSQLALESSNINYYKNAIGGIADSYYGLGEYKKGFDCLNRYTAMKDSLSSEDLNKQISELTAQYESDKKDSDLASKEEQIKFAALQNARQRMLIAASVLALLASLIAIFFVYRSFKQNKKNARQLAFKNQVIQEKNKEITDSINYAKLIQQSLLASQEMLDKNLRKHFIMYRPKDIVSGDFYWGAETSKGFVIACVDCTGHGVPGAFMSLIGKENLDKAVSKFQSPGMILSELNRSVKRSLNQSHTGGKDGMDAALVLIQKDEVVPRIIYSGANRPLWIVKNTSSQLIEIKATKSPVGGLTSDDQEFSEHQIELGSGDMVYISTDGFADQFGSEKNKKLTSKRFKELLISISALDCEKQHQELDRFFSEWKGNNEQLDDLLVIGIKI